jgi:hypothetical protein
MVSAVPSINSIQRLLTQTDWDYSPGIRCPFHEVKDTKFCTLAQVQRWCFAIFDTMKTTNSVYNFSLTDKHVAPPPKVTFHVVSPKDALPAGATNLLEDSLLSTSSKTDMRPQFFEQDESFKMHTFCDGAIGGVGISHVSDINNWPKLGKVSSEVLLQAAYLIWNL